MNRILIAVLGFIVSAALTGCGASETPVEKSNTARTGDANAAPAGSSTTTTTNPTAPVSNNSSPGNTNAAAENPLMATRNRKLEAMRQAAADPSAPKPDIEVLLQRSTRPAPENSEFSVTLTNVVVERRRFLKHPILVTVEKVSDGTESNIKLVTTEGRSIDLPGTAIKNLSIASAASILKAARIDSRSQPSDRKPGAANGN